NLRRTRAIARKEFWHILRDYQSLIAAIGMPLLLLALFGYALSLDVDRVPIAIYDEAHTADSQDLIQAFRGSRYFEVSTASSYAEIEQGIFRNTILMGVVIPRDYSREIGAGRDAQVQLLLDGSDSNTASLARGYAEGLVREHAAAVAVSNLNRKGRSGVGGG